MGAVRAMRVVVRWMLPVLGGMAQQGRPTIPGPNHPFTWEMNRSTILMPCNMSGILRPSWTRGWGIVDVDWSNAKGEWAKAKPMNCEEMLADQARLTTAATPGSTVWVYRNSIKALPWFTTVRVKLTDPDYAAWFMRFSAAIVANHSAAHVPVCDGTTTPRGARTCTTTSLGHPATHTATATARRRVATSGPCQWESTSLTRARPTQASTVRDPAAHFILYNGWTRRLCVLGRLR